MKKLLSLLLLIPALASANSTSNQFQHNKYNTSQLESPNFITNPYALKNTRGWTVSQVTLARDTDSADQFNGVASFALTTATHTAFMRTDDITLGKPLADSNTCMAQVWYKGDGSKWQLEVRPSGGGSVTASTALTNVSVWTKSSPILVACADSARIYVTSNAASPADLNVAGFYWGPARSSSIGYSTFQLSGGASGLTTFEQVSYTPTWTAGTGVTAASGVGGDCDRFGNQVRCSTYGAIQLTTSNTQGLVTMDLPSGLQPDSNFDGTGASGRGLCAMYSNGNLSGVGALLTTNAAKTLTLSYVATNTNSRTFVCNFWYKLR